MNILYRITLVMLLLFLCNISIGQDVEKILKSDPFKFSGAISANTSLASIQGDDDRISPYFYSLNTRLNFEFKSLKIPVYFSIRDHSFHYGSTIPRFKFSPKYKWAQLTVGNVYTNFNPYVLNQRNVRGAGIKLTPGNLRFQALYGKMKDLNAYRDTLELGVVENETFSRKVAGIALGYGTARNNTDIYIIKSWDNLDSLYYLQRDLKAKSNVIVGNSLRLRLFKKVNFVANSGLSFQTNDLYGIGEESIIGENAITDNLFVANATTSVRFAGDLAINYSSKIYGLNGKVSYVQSQYQPLTVAYVNTDLVNYTVGGFLSLFRNKLYVTSSVGVQHNNLSKISANTTNRFIVHTISRFKFTNALSANVVISNFSQDYTAKLVNINQLYTYAVSNSNQSISFDFIKPINQKKLSLRVSYGQNSFETVAENDIEQSSYSGSFALASVGLDFEESDLGFHLITDYRKYDKLSTETSNYGLGLEITKGFLNKKIQFQFRTDYHLIDQLEYREGSNLLNQFSFRYNTDKKRSLNLSMIRIARSSVVRSDFIEYRSQLSYSHKF